MSARTAAGKIIGPACLTGWLVAVLVGMALMLHYQMTPETADAAVASQWPTGVVVQRDATRPTLIMTLHPHCPCSRASLAELSVLMARANGALAVRILFVQPEGATRQWVEGDLWKTATAIDGATVSVDAGGKDSETLGATTSGTVIVYDRNGRDVFHGGITDGRGHEGDNTGLLAILSLIRSADPVIHTTPVYGCPLQSSSHAACQVRKAS